MLEKLKASVEDFEHDVCPKCGEPSLPAEGVRDQSLCVCSNEWCLHEFFEDLTRPVQTEKVQSESD